MRGILQVRLKERRQMRKRGDWELGVGDLKFHILASSRFI
jgi:hypothetical protein